jgi:hypothetical protein
MDEGANLPACGLYRTARPVAGVPAGRLVYFHNHGNPGPGVYLPERWQGNKAVFAERGQPLESPRDAACLEPLEPEGFYRVVEPFHCCERQCRRFEPDMLVQLGYNGAARPILFLPEWANGALTMPERGTPIDIERLEALRRLRVPTTSAKTSTRPSQATLH